jgi:hypothetical protein
MWALSFQRAVAEARDELAEAMRPLLQRRRRPTAEAILAAASGIGLTGDAFRIRQLVGRNARPVEIVNAIVAHHFRMTTNDVQNARRDVKTSYPDLDEIITR